MPEPRSSGVRVVDGKLVIEVRWPWWYRPVVWFDSWRWRRRHRIRDVASLTDEELRERGLPTSQGALDLARYQLDSYLQSRFRHRGPADR